MEKSPISIAFGMAVKQIRLQQNLTQLELAERCQVNRSYVARIEQGMKNPTLSVIWNLAVQMNCSIDSLMALTSHYLVIER